MRLLPRKVFSRPILSLAIPAVAGLSSQTIVSIVDAALIGRLDRADIALAAMGLGLLATWALTSFFSSFGTGTHVLVARRQGEGNYFAAGEVLNNSLLICLVLGIVVAALGYTFSYEIIDFFSNDPAVTEEGDPYIGYRFLGLPFFLLIVAYRGFFFGIGHTRVFMFSAIIINAVNIILDVLLIYGEFGLPRMGLAGAGLAYSISMVVGWLFFVAISTIRMYRRPYRYFSHFRLSFDVMRQVIKIALPVSVQNILILLGFLLFVTITGMIGTTEQAASQVVITALFMSFMPCFGLGIAAQTLVGQMIGEGSPKRALMYGFETAKIGTMFTAIVGAIFVLVPDAVLIIITTDPTVTAVARPILQIAGVAQVAYGAGLILANALQAGGATVYVMIVEVITHWVIFLPLAYLFGVVLGWGIRGAWLALPVYIIMFTLMNYWKFRSLSWIHIKI
jgi:MATE family multidrug resistance protein